MQAARAWCRAIVGRIAEAAAHLHYEDRNSMAHATKAREPILDYDLCELLVNSAPSLKFRHGWKKLILRQSLKDISPENILFRKTKLGFDTPQTEWMGDDLQEAINAALACPEFRMRRFLVAKKVQDEFAKFFPGQADS